MDKFIFSIQIYCVNNSEHWMCILCWHLLVMWVSVPSRLFSALNVIWKNQVVENVYKWLIVGCFVFLLFCPTTAKKCRTQHCLCLNDLNNAVRYLWRCLIIKCTAKEMLVVCCWFFFFHFAQNGHKQQSADRSGVQSLCKQFRLAKCVICHSNQPNLIIN